MVYRSYMGSFSILRIAQGRFYWWTTWSKVYQVNNEWMEFAWAYLIAIGREVGSVCKATVYRRDFLTRKEPLYGIWNGSILLKIGWTFTYSEAKFWGDAISGRDSRKVEYVQKSSPKMLSYKLNHNSGVVSHPRVERAITNILRYRLKKCFIMSVMSLFRFFIFSILYYLLVYVYDSYVSILLLYYRFNLECYLSLAVLHIVHFK